MLRAAAQLVLTGRYRCCEACLPCAVLTWQLELQACPAPCACLMMAAAASCTTPAVLRSPGWPCCCFSACPADTPSFALPQGNIHRRREPSALLHTLPNRHHHHCTQVRFCDRPATAGYYAAWSRASEAKQDSGQQMAERWQAALSAAVLFTGRLQGQV